MIKVAPQQGNNSMKKCNMDMNTDASATDTIKEKYSMQNLKQDMKQYEPNDMPGFDASAANWELFIFTDIWKIVEDVSSIMSKHENLKERVEQFIIVNKTMTKFLTKVISSILKLIQ